MIARTIIRAAVITLAALAAGFTHSRLHKPLDLSFAIHPPAPVPAPPVIDPGGSGVPPVLPPAQLGQGMIDLSAFKALLAAPPVQVLDAREPGDFSKGHIPGAWNLPMSAFFSNPQPDLVNALSRDLPIVVYCGGGDCDASRFVAKRLKEMGFLKMSVYEDGFTGWTKAGEPVEVLK